MTRQDLGERPPEPRRALLALGSNLPRRDAWLDLGTQVLLENGAELLASSPRWNTRALGAPPQPDYLDQLLLLAAPLTGIDWLELAQGAEARARRRRSVPRAPRTLDVDVVLIDGESWQTTELTVPHPALLERPYLLLGAAQLVPDWRLPGGGETLAELATERLEGAWRPPADAR